MKCYRALVALIVLLAAVAGRAEPLADLFKERLKSVVAVEFFVQDEIERHPITVMGTVVDDQGTVILPGAVISPAIPPDQLKDFKVYRPNSVEPYTATYLGQDAFTGWHFLRVEEKLRLQLVPITQYHAAAAEPGLGQELWGLGLRNKEEDFTPYLLSARIALITKLPQKTAIFGGDVAGPGLPVFDLNGALAGLAQTSFGQNFLLLARNQNPAQILLVNVEESSVVLLIDEVLPYFKRVPQSVLGRPLAWLGAYGVQPVDPEVAKLLQLGDQPGVVLSELMDDSPATKAGLKERDIVLAFDGKPFPRLKPDQVVIGYFAQEVLRRLPGDEVTLQILRDGARQEIKVMLGDEPKMVREATRQYFGRLGFTVREFVPSDGIFQRVKSVDQSGVVVRFVKQGSPVAVAGLRPDDWIREIDGEDIKTYEQAVKKLLTIEADRTRPEIVLLVNRNGETSVLRVKIN